MAPLAEVLDGLGPVVTTLGPVGIAMAAAARAVWSYARGHFERRDAAEAQRQADIRETEAALRAAQLAQISRLDAELGRERAERERERAEAKETITRLGAEKDGLRQLRQRDAEKTATAILEHSTPEQASLGAQQWHELPTGVHNLLEIAKAAPKAPVVDPFSDLAGFDPWRRTTPPGGTPSP